jgi:predicted AlkP superfamily pyrophosphatase or phosphodiesterase
VSTLRLLNLAVFLLVLTVSFPAKSVAQSGNKIQHVLLISVDGMHSLDFANCAKGMPSFGNQPYCPHLAALSATGVHYLQALTPKPSDSFPGLVAQITGGTPRSAGMYYDVSYEVRFLLPPRPRRTESLAGRNFAPA